MNRKFGRKPLSGAITAKPCRQELKWNSKVLKTLKKVGINLSNMKIKLGNRTIGDGQSVYIIAEAGVNHNGDIKLAKKMIDLAKNAGADCIKFQTFKAEELIADRTSTYTYRSQGKEVTESQFKMFKRREFSASDWQQIIDYCQKRKVVFATT